MLNSKVNHYLKLLLKLKMSNVKTHLTLNNIKFLNISKTKVKNNMCKIQLYGKETLENGNK